MAVVACAEIQVCPTTNGVSLHRLFPLALDHDAGPGFARIQTCTHATQIGYQEEETCNRTPVTIPNEHPINEAGNWKQVSSTPTSASSEHHLRLHIRNCIQTKVTGIWQHALILQLDVVVQHHVGHEGLELSCDIRSSRAVKADIHEREPT